MSTKKSYTKEFKENVVKMVIEQGMKQVEVSRTMNIHVNLIAKWIRQYKEEHGGIKNQTDTEKELKTLLKKIAELEEENQILKKAAAYFAKNQK